MKDSLGDRMKSYENVSRIYLTPRMPVIIRIDGKSFHSYTKIFNKPFDDILIKGFIETSKKLLKEVMNARIAYTQSDEISILLNNYANFDTQSWFGNNIQKIASVSASITTAHFNKYIHNLKGGNFSKIAYFDARVFTIPKEDVPNYFLWRYKDCKRNAVSSLAQCNFSHKALQNVKQDGMISMLKESGICWDSYSNDKRFGIFITKEGDKISVDNFSDILSKIKLELERPEE